MITHNTLLYSAMQSKLQGLDMTCCYQCNWIDQLALLAICVQLYWIGLCVQLVQFPQSISKCRAHVHVPIPALHGQLLVCTRDVAGECGTMSHDHLDGQNGGTRGVCIWFLSSGHLTQKDSWTRTEDNFNTVSLPLVLIKFMLPIEMKV